MRLRTHVEVEACSRQDEGMILLRRYSRICASAVLSVLGLGMLTLGSSACAAPFVQAQDDEIIRTAPIEQRAVRSSHASTAQTFDAISGFLDEAAAAWSSGDLDQVMATYGVDEPLLVFLGDQPLKGPDAVRSALEVRAAEGGLGTMSYEWFETLQFDANTAVVSGRIIMARKGGIHRALFTRVLRRTEDGWKIVHDQIGLSPGA